MHGHDILTLLLQDLQEGEKTTTTDTDSFDGPLLTPNHWFHNHFLNQYNAKVGMFGNHLKEAQDFIAKAMTESQ